MFKGPKSKTHQGIPIQRACDGVSFLTNTKEAFGQSLPYGCWRQLVLIVRESLAGSGVSRSSLRMLFHFMC